MKPMIGIITRPEISTGGHPITCIYEEVKNAVLKHGGLPIGICPTTTSTYFGCTLVDTPKLSAQEWRDLKRILQQCDGVILQGGDHFYDYDLKIIDDLYKRNIPTFGICLGMQAMGYLFGGKVCEISKNIKIEHHSSKPLVHEVRIDPYSRLFQILKQEYIMVNSRHKELLAKTDLSISAISQDQIIEAIEDPSKKFFLGVQWHPESMIAYDDGMNRLFAHFVACCKEEKHESK